MSDPFASYRYSFETVAEQYERNRPPYADEAVAWVAERLGIVPGSRVLDLAAGTGKLTRQLLALGAEVVAVEPGDEMRAVLERVLPDVEALAGVAEAIPLPDASVDAVAVGQAFHWFDHDAALAEIRRVLRPGGGLGLLWNRWDEADPLLAAVDELLRVARPPIAERRDLGCRVEERTFHQRRPLSIDQIVGWASSTSGWVNSPREEQERLEREIRRLGEGYAGEVSIATTAIVALS